MYGCIVITVVEKARCMNVRVFFLGYYSNRMDMNIGYSALMPKIPHGGGDREST